MVNKDSFNRIMFMNQTPESQFPIEISVTEVKQRLDSGDIVLIDCREQSEYDQCRIDGSVFMPMNEIPEKLDVLEPHRGKQIVVHCHLGGRSMKVTQYLRGQGFDKAQNMAGGIDAWSVEVDPKVERD